MTFTDNCDLFGSVHEDGINRVIEHFMQQRPSLFNYGTLAVTQNPELFCRRINAAPSVIERKNRLITPEPPIPVVGTSGLVGMNYCIQFSKLEIDFHPGNTIALPPELQPPLGAQRFALRGQVCGGLGCPVGGTFKDLDRYLDYAQGAGKDERRPDPIVIPTRKLACFCIDLFVTGHFEITGPKGGQVLETKIDGLEIVDLKPDGLEQSIECYLRTAIVLGILPKIRIKLEKITFEIMSGVSVQLFLTPISAAVPNNPAVEDDQIKGFISFEVVP